MRLVTLASILALSACGEDNTDTDTDTDTGTDTAEEESEADACDIRPIYASCTAEGLIDFGSGSGTIDLTWDSAGNLTERITDAGVGRRIEAYEYDSDGRLVLQTNTMGSGIETIDYTYNEDGNTTSRTSSLGSVQRWTYDDQGRLLTETWDYNADGEPDESCTYTWPTDAEWDYEAVCDFATIRVVLHEPSGEIAQLTRLDNTSGETFWTESWTYREDCQPEQQTGEFDTGQGLNQLLSEWGYDEAGRKIMQSSETDGPNPRVYFEELTYSCGE